MSALGFKFIVGFFLILMLVDSSFAGFIPKAFEGNFSQIKGKEKISLIKISKSKNVKARLVSGKKDKVCFKNKNTNCIEKTIALLRNGLKSNSKYRVFKKNELIYNVVFKEKTAKELGFDILTLKFKTNKSSFKNLQMITFKNKKTKKYITFNNDNIKILGKVVSSSKKVPVRNISSKGFIPKAFEGNFTQEKKNARGRVKTSTVKIKYMFPNNIRMEDSKSKIIYVCNARKTWIYQPSWSPKEKGTVKEGKSSKYCYSKIFDALNHGLKDNPVYKVKKLSKTKYELKLSKEATNQLGYHYFNVSFNSEEVKFSNLKSIQLRTNGKKPVLLRKNSVKTFKSLSMNNFIFKIPKNVEVQKMK